jgi:hypothetical protein
VAQIHKAQRTPQWAWTVYGLFAAATVAWLAVAVVHRAHASAITAGLTLVLWIFVGIRVPRRRATAITKADRAEAAALAVLGRYNTAHWMGIIAAESGERSRPQCGRLVRSSACRVGSYFPV